jgi:serine/threonine-protein kinase
VHRICPTCRATYPATESTCVADATPLIEGNPEDQVALARLGSMVGNYRLLSVVGRGGMGTVYAAEHVYIGKRAAMKILHQRHAANADSVERFLREARAATSANHPNIVDVYDFGATPAGETYLAMELLDGRSLEDLLDRDGPLQLHRAINIVHQISSALAAAHEKGIAHSDLKPANVMLIQRPGRREIIRAAGTAPDGQPRFVVEKEGAFDFVKVLDFGIAHIQDRPDGDAARHVFGTPEYMAPEAARGEAVDARSDIYGLGILFYEMLTGTVPFHAAEAIDVLRMHVGTPPPRPTAIAPAAEITPAAERLILRALAKDAAARPQSMDDLRAELAGCYGSVAFRRDAHRVPGAVAQGLRPRSRRLTEELDEWLAREKALAVARQANTARMTAIGSEPADAPVEEPLLLTDRKPI